MKNLILTYLFALCAIFSIFSQENKIEDPLSYPFGETGKPAPRGVYGEDDRKEVKDAYGIKDYVRATAVMIPKINIRGNKVYGYSLRELLTNKFGSSNFDENVNFLDQPTCASCTGFLIAPDILVTAGHCIKNFEDAKDYVWIFDYTNELNYYPNERYITVDPSNIYEVVEIIDAYFEEGEKFDYSVLKLNRTSDRKPYRFRTSGKISSESNVYTIGSPTGLPLKFVDNSFVVGNSEKDWFKNSIDGFPGNSGGPVFNTDGFIEGIHVRGAVELHNGSYTGDYKYDSNCDCIKTVKWESTLWTAGAQAHRITSIPFDLHHKAIYDNIKYAIINNLPERLNSWIIYSWILDHDYTKNRGRLEFIAAKNNNLEALKKIVEVSSTEAVDMHDRNILFYAIINNNLAMLNYLIEKDFLVDYRDTYGHSPLSYAIDDKSSINIINSLINNGADITTTDSNGNNLLHFAADIGNINLIKKFIKLGVSAKTKNNYGKLPEDVAKKKKHKKARKHLKKARKRKK